MAKTSADILIVGGGPAGCVLAARLSEHPDRSVLLLEAGPDYGPDPADWPPDMLDPVGLRADTHSWNYLHVGRELPLPRARVIGGSTTVNGAMWIRGSRRDYDEWAALGNAGWGWNDLLPAFQRAESDPLAPDGLHGSSGPVTVARASREQLSEIERAFVESAQEIAFPWLNDINGAEEQSPGIGPTPKNLSDGWRLNSALSYLTLARGRENFRIEPNVMADRLLLDGRQCRGVVAADGQEFLAREVILCCGTYGSPAILLRSGIGPEDELRELVIEPVLDLPGVGRHLLDHPQVARQSGLTTFKIKPEFEPERPSFINTMLKARSSQVDEEIDLHLYPGEAFDEETGCWTLAFGVSLQYARSRGTVRLTSRDPEAPLEIDHNYFSDPRDLEAICDGYELMLRIVDTPPLRDRLSGPLRPGEHLRDRDALRRVVREEVGTTYHPSSTCRMGPTSDPAAVVDPECRVRGVAGLRVVDASIFPTGPRANLHFTVCAVAERAAELLSGPAYSAG